MDSSYSAVIEQAMRLTYDSLNERQRRLYAANEANVLERAQILAENNRITLDDLPENLQVAPTNADAAADDRSSILLCDVERRHIGEVMLQMKGNKVSGARALGISRRALYRLIAKYQIE